MPTNWSLLLCVIVVIATLPAFANKHDTTLPESVEGTDDYSIGTEGNQDIDDLDLGELVIGELDLGETHKTCVIPKSVLVTRWFWWILIIFMFYAQATVCDEYFVTTIQEVCERYEIPGDVAGATLMALGCNGPELFTNFIAIFITHSDVGVGTIIGSELFNVLCIVGGSIMCCPDPPLEIDGVPFARDVFFYGLSVGMLYWVLYDGIVSCVEAYVLLLGCVVFAVSVMMTARIVKCFGADEEAELLEEHNHKLEGDEVRICVQVENRMVMQRAPSVILNLDDEGGLTRTRSHKRVSYRETVRKSRTSTANSDDVGLQRKKSGFPELKDDEGVVDILEGKFEAIHDKGGNRFEVVVEGPLGQHVEYEIETGDERHKKELIKKVEDTHPEAKQEVTSGIAHALEELQHDWKSGTKPLILKIFTLIASPIPLGLALTIGWCDVRVPSKKGLWPCCFCMSMVWLAIFSYLMCHAADKLHEGYCFSNAILGITLCAIGTSFPNFYASLIMAKKGHAGMAIANALGSNVQNVFLALSIPWCVRTSFSSEVFEVKAAGILSGVMWMAGTLLFVIITSSVLCIRFPVWTGYVFIALYLVYLGFAIF